MKEVVIAGAARTPMGGFQGVFDGVEAAILGGAAIRAALRDAGVDTVDEVLMGCVLPAGQGQAPARQAGFAGGLGIEVPATTLNKMCGSGMKAAMLAWDRLALGQAQVIVAGGMESMSRAPYLLPQMRDGARIGHGQVVDHMFLDGLEDAYEEGRLMGSFAEDCAEKYQFTREDQDAYAIESVTRAKAAAASGAFDWELTPVTVKTRKGEVTVTQDEGPQRIDPDRIPSLRPAFKKDGTITAASSSSINDGAAAIALASAERAKALGLTPLARIVGHAAFAAEPGWFTTAPVYAKKRLLEQTGWRIEEVDLFEINEAFACVPMASMRELDIPHDRLNVHGGAVALGHPIGASGARIMVTLLGAMKARNAKRGIASICIGGGEATAIALEML